MQFHFLLHKMTTIPACTWALLCPHSLWGLRLIHWDIDSHDTMMDDLSESPQPEMVDGRWSNVSLFSKENKSSATRHYY